MCRNFFLVVELHDTIVQWLIYVRIRETLIIWFVHVCTAVHAIYWNSRLPLIRTLCLSCRSFLFGGRMWTVAAFLAVLLAATQAAETARTATQADDSDIDKPTVRMQRLDTWRLTSDRCFGSPVPHWSHGHRRDEGNMKFKSFSRFFFEWLQLYAPG